MAWLWSRAELGLAVSQTRTERATAEFLRQNHKEPNRRAIKNRLVC